MCGTRSMTVAVRTGNTAPLLLFELKGYCGGLPKCSLFSLFKPTLPPTWEHILRYNTNFVNICVHKMPADRKCYYSVLWLQIQIQLENLPLGLFSVICVPDVVCVIFLYSNND